MLFALFDFLQYRAERGHYSHDAIVAQGGILANDALRERIGKLGAADIFFYHGRGSALSWAVMYFTNSIWSHVGTCVGGDRIVDATTSGVIEHSLADYLDGRGYLDFRTVEGITDEQRAAVASHARSTVGAGYNWVGVLRLYAAIITGYHASFRWRYVADVLIALMFLSALGLVWSPMWRAGLFLAIIYVLLLIVFYPARLEMRERFRRSGIPTP
jgi:hypothetical protein